MRLTGIHHLTAMTADPARNADFYTRVLGLRMVKKTVNFDDPGAWHLYYGDDTGAPGTILTFFAFPGAFRGRPGAGAPSAFAFQIAPQSFGYWRERLARLGVPVVAEEERFGGPVLVARDPDGFAVELAAVEDPREVSAPRGSDVPRGHEIRGFHGVTFPLAARRATGGVLERMGARFEREEGGRFRYVLGEGPERARIDLVELPDGPRGSGGAGTLHHTAWRAADREAQLEAREELEAAGLAVSPVIDRSYFRSVYFREPGGLLFEIATDPPGFTADEPLEELGGRLSLPPWLEPHRARIGAALPPLS